MVKQFIYFPMHTYKCQLEIDVNKVYKLIIHSPIVYIKRPPLEGHLELVV